MWFLIIVIMGLVPFMTAYVIRKYKKKLHHDHIRISISNLYNGIQVAKGGKRVYYKAIFMMKRFMFVAIPSFLINEPAIQLQVLMAMNLAYLSGYMYEMPHFSGTRLGIEIVNEILTMIGLYHFMTFSNFNTSLSA